MSVEVTPATDIAFDAEWDALAARTPFQTSGWYRAWLAGAAESEGAEPLLVRTPRAAVALQISDHDGERAIRPLGFPWADYHDAIGADDDALAASILQLKRELQLPLLLHDVLPEGILDRTMRRLGATLSDASPVGAIDLTNEIPPRREFARKERQLQRLDELHIVHHRDHDHIAPRLPLFIAMHRRQWAGRQDAVAPFDGGVVDNTFAMMVRFMAPAGAVVLTELLLGGEPIAMYFGFVRGSRYFGYRTCFSQEHRRWSPGQLMLRWMIRDFAAAGLTTLDLMRGAYAYKSEYVRAFRHNRRLELR
jgi:CelD/BcsL family acetyltransferase involved in cellulose biosynthesis